MVETEALEFHGLDLNSTATVVEIPVSRWQKANIQLHDLSGSVGSTVLTVTRSVARGYANAAGFTSPATLDAAGEMTGALDVTAYRWVYVAVTTVAGGALSGNLTVHLEETP